MIICGDAGQVDLKNKKFSGFKFLFNNADRVNKMAAITLKSNHRDPIVDELLNLYSEHDPNKE
jgi:phosphate starvation-inducible protein PhoH